MHHEHIDTLYLSYKAVDYEEYKEILDPCIIEQAWKELVF